MAHIKNQAVNVKLAAFFMLLRKQCVNKLFEFTYFRDLSVFEVLCYLMDTCNSYFIPWKQLESCSQEKELAQTTNMIFLTTMLKKIKMKNSEVEQLSNASQYVFPKYATQIDY